MNERFYIVEFSEENIMALAQGLHVLLENNPNHVPPAEALTHLIQQTPNVYRKASNHQVFSKLSAPKEAIDFDKVSYIPS